MLATVLDTSIRSGRWVLAALLLSVAVPARLIAADWDQVARARALYNAGRYEEAITEAAAARADPDTGPTASLVMARALLERFRADGAMTDLDIAQATLRAIPANALQPRDRLEWETGVAEVLFLEGQYGPAAEWFGRLLAAGSVAGPERQRLLHWWASAIESDASEVRADGDADRSTTHVREAYRRILERMDTELAADIDAPAAAYWLAAGARGAGELDRAWNAAVVGWVNAGTTADGRTLRDDLNRLMLEGIIPEIARRQTARDRSETAATVDAMAALAAAWEAIKNSWAPPRVEAPGSGSV